MITFLVNVSFSFTTNSIKPTIYVVCFFICVATLLHLQDNLYNKRACPTKNEPQQGISSLEREREGDERERGGKG